MALLREFYTPLVRLRDETPGFGVSLIKAGLRLRGLDVGSVRPPLVDPTPEQEARLGALLDAGLALAERLGARGGGTVTPTIRRLATRAIRVPLRRPGDRTCATSRSSRSSSRTPRATAATGSRGRRRSAPPPCGRTSTTTSPRSPWAAMPTPRRCGIRSGCTCTRAAGAASRPSRWPGLDLALWDLAARRAGVGITDHLGRRHETAEVYGSGVNLHYPLDELVAQAERWVAAGFDAVKVKVGSPDLADDVAPHRRRARGDRPRPPAHDRRQPALDARAGRTRPRRARARSASRGSRSRCAPTTSPGTRAAASASTCRSPSARTSTPATASPSSSTPAPSTSCSPTSCASAASRRSARSPRSPTTGASTLAPHLLLELSAQLALDAAGRAPRRVRRGRRRSRRSARSPRASPVERRPAPGVHHGPARARHALHERRMRMPRHPSTHDGGTMTTAAPTTTDDAIVDRSLDAAAAAARVAFATTVASTAAERSAWLAAVADALDAARRRAGADRRRGDAPRHRAV